MSDGDCTHPTRGRQRPQRDAAPDRPRDVQRRHGGVEVGRRRLEVVGHRQQLANGVVETEQHPWRRDGIRPVDAEPAEARDHEDVAVPAVTVAAQPQQQQDERCHAEVHDEVVRRQRVSDRALSGQPVVEGLGPGHVPHLVEMQHRATVAQRRGSDVAVQGAHFVVARREANDEKDLQPPTRATPGQGGQVHPTILTTTRSGCPARP